MKADQDRVRMLISQTITMLCKKGLEFETELKVQGLLGVTIDSKDIFLIHLNEKYDTVSDTKDVIQQQDSVATSTRNEKFSPVDVLPDAGLGCGATLPASSEVVKKEPEPLSPTLNRMENQPTFTDLHDSMTDVFPYSECQTTENASTLLGPEESGESGYLMEMGQIMTPSIHSGQRAGKGNHMGDSAGVILLDSGDEGIEEGKTGQFEFNMPEVVSKSKVSMLLDDKTNLQAAYSQHDFKPCLVSEGQQQYNSDAELSYTSASQSRSWALQPFLRSPLPPQSPGRVPFQSQQGQFSPERFATFSVGMNQFPALQSSPGQNIFPTRGAPPRRSPGVLRQLRPMTPGRAGMLSPMSTAHTSPALKVQSPTGSSSMSSPSVMSPAMMRGLPRTRRARGSTQMQRGASTSASATGAVVPFTGSSGAVMRGGAARMSRGSTSLRTRTLDGYSYGKQTVTNYICNLCQAVYKNHSSLLTHQVKVHGRQKKEGKGRPKMQPAEMYEDDDDEDEDAEMDTVGNMSQQLW